MSALPNNNPRVFTDPELHAVNSIEQVAEVFEDFPVDLLPPVVADLVAEVANATCKSSVLAAPIALGALSAAIGPGLRIATTRGRNSYANLFTLTVAESGSYKSDTYRYCFDAIGALDSHRVDQWDKVERPELECQLMDAKNRLKDLQKSGGDELGRRQDAMLIQKEIAGIELEMRHLPQLVSDDATPASIPQTIARAQNTCLTITSPDAREMIDVVLGKYSASEGTEENFLVRGYSVERTNYTRVGKNNGVATVIDRPCLSMAICIQPDKFQSMLLHPNLHASGYMQRNLLSAPPASALMPQPDRDASNCSVSQAKQSVYNDLLTELCTKLRLSESGRSPIVTPTKAATEILADYAYDCECKAHFTGELSDVRSYVKRWAEQAGKVALCLHAGLHGADAANHPPDEDTMRNAIGIVEWFSRQQLESLDQTRIKRRGSTQERAIGYIARKAREGKPCGIRTLVSGKVTGSASETRAMLGQLIADGFVEKKAPIKFPDGNTAEHFELTPKGKKEMAEK